MMFYFCFEIFGTCAFSWLHDSIFAHVAKQKLPSNPHLLVAFCHVLAGSKPFGKMGGFYELGNPSES